jgi:hypothetical protein
MAKALSQHAVPNQLVLILYTRLEVFLAANLAPR